MTEKEKAYCGDAIAQLVIGELRGGEGNKAKKRISGVLSNKAMTIAYCAMNKIKLEKIENPTMVRGYYKMYGTKFEAYLYDVFKEKGYEEAKKIVETWLIPLQNNGIKLFT
jgi:hypothetical protein